LGGSLKAEGFGDGECRRRHPQAALEAATPPSYKIKFDRLLAPACANRTYVQQAVS